MNKGKSPLEYITQTFGRTWPEKISWGLWPHSAPILLRENPELPQQGKELHLTLSGVINFSDGWLCGTSILKDFNISVYTFTLKGFEAGDYGWDNYWKRPTTAFTEAFREYLETKREGILDSIFPILLSHLGLRNDSEGGNNAIIMGGRTTPWVKGTQWQIRSFELAEYISRRGIGTISGTHGHLNKNHKDSSAMSVQQYWLWTYEGAIPQVAFTDKERCGVFNAKPDTEKLFTEHWQKKAISKERMTRRLVVGE